MRCVTESAGYWQRSVSHWRTGPQDRAGGTGLGAARPGCGRVAVLRADHRSKHGSPHRQSLPYLFTIVTGPKASICPCASKSTQTQIGVCARESEGLLLVEEMGPSLESRESCPQRPSSRRAPRGRVTQGRVISLRGDTAVVSTDPCALGRGGWPLRLVLTLAVCPSVQSGKGVVRGSVCFSGSGAGAPPRPRCHLSVESRVRRKGGQRTV